MGDAEVLTRKGHRKGKFVEPKIKTNLVGEFGVFGEFREIRWQTAMKEEGD